MRSGPGMYAGNRGFVYSRETEFYAQRRRKYVYTKFFCSIARCASHVFFHFSQASSWGANITASKPNLENKT